MSYTPLSEKSRKNIAKEIESVQHLITLIPQVQEVIKKYDGAEPTTRTINKIRKELRKIDEHLDYSYAYSHIKVEHNDYQNEIETYHCLYSVYDTGNKLVLVYKEEAFEQTKEYLQSYCQKFNDYLEKENLLLECLQRATETYNAVVDEIPAVCQRLVGVRVSHL